MKSFNAFFIAVIVAVATGFTPIQEDHVVFSCLKKIKASNTCHFNFIVDGQKFRYVDSGCKSEKKKEEIIKKAKAGELALAKDWKIDCPEVKKAPGKKAEGF
jgi:hypothetical protein